MSTRKIGTETELVELTQSGDLIDGALVRTQGGILWLVYDSEDGLYAVRPMGEDEIIDSGGPHVPVLEQFEDFPLPLYVTMEDH